jgi:hypothetical protein
MREIVDFFLQELDYGELFAASLTGFLSGELSLWQVIPAVNNWILFF